MAGSNMDLNKIKTKQGKRQLGHKSMTISMSISEFPHVILQVLNSNVFFACGSVLIAIFL